MNFRYESHFNPKLNTMNGNLMNGMNGMNGNTMNRNLFLTARSAVLERVKERGGEGGRAHGHES